MSKKLLLLLFAFLPLWVAAQTTSMTDEQVMAYIMKEYQAGTSQTDIISKLVARGVDIEQIRRVRERYQNQMQSQGLGQVSDDDMDEATSRLRTNVTDAKGKTLTNAEVSAQEMQRAKSMAADGLTTQRMQGELGTGLTPDEYDIEYLQYQIEMGLLLPTDTALLVEQLLAEREMRRKQVFGRDIFNNKNLTFEPNMNIATPQNYQLGPGDAVIIDIYGASQKTIDATVSPDGEIVIEGFGPIDVSGMTVERADAVVKAKLGPRYSSSNVRVTLGQTRTITVNVMGEVAAPGTYSLSAFASVFHALYMAGGTSDIGTLRDIKVYRNSRLISSVDIYDYILNGKLAGNVRLADGDVISVDAYDCLVNVTGKVKRPMFYEMKKDESVATLIKYAGGFTGDAYTKSVRLVRKTGRDFTVYNIDEFDMSSFNVADGDSLAVDSVIQRFSNMAEIKGAVFRPGMYQVGGNITSVRSLIEHAEGLREEAFTARAVMHRMKADRTLEVVSVDVDGIMNGTAADIALKENDVLFIPTRTDVQMQRTLTIHGEVLYPGTYKYADNETVEDFILQAGGLTDAASTIKVDVARRIVNPRATKPDSIISHTYSFALKDGFVVDGEPGFTLQPFDEVYVRKSPGYNKQQNVTIEGEVVFEGTYTLTRNDMRLSDLVTLAGGFNSRAYVAGARLERMYNDAERKRAEDVLQTAKEQYETMMLELAANSKNAIDLKDSEKLEKFQLGTSYPVGIELDKAIENPGSDDDLVLREGDRLVVPPYNGTVKVNGEVMYPNSVAYVQGKKAKYYINQAGGFTESAKKRQAYIMYMNGTIAKVNDGARPMPGCEIVVPTKSITKLSTTERLAVGTSIASIAAMIATVINAFN